MRRSGITNELWLHGVCLASDDAEKMKKESDDDGIAPIGVGYHVATESGKSAE